jgi:DNA-binding response OmpR family regulator
MTSFRSPHSSATRRRPLTVLIAEDNDLIRENVRRYLEGQGYHVITARDGKDALYVLGKEKVHLLILDLMLPELDGFAVLRHVRDERRGRFPYIIVISGLITNVGRRVVGELGGHGYLPKPFRLSQLAERIAEMKARFRF